MKFESRRDEVTVDETETIDGRVEPEFKLEWSPSLDERRPPLELKAS